MSEQTDSTETITSTQHYHTGHNIPGYLSESDVYVTADWHSARDSLIEDLDCAADSMADSELYPGYILAEYETAIRELGTLEPESEFYVKVPSSDSEFDLGIAYWLEICLAADCQPDSEEWWG